MIIWLNGGFAAGKTTLAEELRQRIPASVVYNPEDLGLMLWKWLGPNDDFQDLPSWRELVIATTVSLCRHHTGTLIVPMSLIRDAYRVEILGGWPTPARTSCTSSWRRTERAPGANRCPSAPPDNSGANQSPRDWAFSRVDAAIAAAARQPDGTLCCVGPAVTGRVGRRSAGCGWFTPG